MTTHVVSPAMPPAAHRPLDDLDAEGRQIAGAPALHEGERAENYDALDIEALAA